MSLLVLVRHGQSDWNEKNLFTGWRDPDLTEKGVQEAKAAGVILGERGYKFDVAFTSNLIRAQRTCGFILDGVGQSNLETIRHEALNERDYGDLAGLNKDDARKKWGVEQVHIWRRSFDIPPPGGESLKAHGGAAAVRRRRARVPSRFGVDAHDAGILRAAALRLPRARAPSPISHAGAGCRDGPRRGARRKSRGRGRRPDLLRRRETRAASGVARGADPGAAAGRRRPAAARRVVSGIRLGESTLQACVFEDLRRPSYRRVGLRVADASDDRPSRRRPRRPVDREVHRLIGRQPAARAPALDVRRTRSLPARSTKRRCAHDSDDRCHRCAHSRDSERDDAAGGAGFAAHGVER